MVSDWYRLDRGRAQGARLRVLYKVALMGLEEPGPVHPAAVEDRLGPAAAYWVENDLNKINAIP